MCAQACASGRHPAQLRVEHDCGIRVRRASRDPDGARHARHIDGRDLPASFGDAHLAVTRVLNAQQPVAMGSVMR